MYEKQIDRLIEVANKVLKNNITSIIEIGARDCTETLIFNKNFPKANIFSFECNPNTLPVCRNKVSSFKNIRLIESAVSETDGKITFNQIDQSKTVTTAIDGNPGASSIFKASGKYPVEQYAQKEIEVNSTRLDSFFKKNNISNVDILWMDIQGAELMALKSLGDFLKDIKIIHLELEFFEIYKGQPLFKDINAFLSKNNFNLIEFTSVGKYSGDGIYIRKDLKRNFVPNIILRILFRIRRKIKHILNKS